MYALPWHSTCFLAAFCSLNSRFRRRVTLFALLLYPTLIATKQQEIRIRNHGCLVWKMETNPAGRGRGAEQSDSGLMLWKKIGVSTWQLKANRQNVPTNIIWVICKASHGGFIHKPSEQPSNASMIVCKFDLLKHVICQLSEFLYR